MSLQFLLPGAIGITLLVAPTISHPAPLVAWNASPSVPIGLYGVTRASPLLGDIALARLPPSAAALAGRRGYLSRFAYLLKPVAAVAGDRICRRGVRIFINEQFAALARLADRFGGPLPIWQGCRTLRTSQVFLLADDPDSFDSRYFGPLGHQHIIGRGFLIW